jgi:Fungal Zn(2)-Cys(6) binuclear cluster domain
METYYNPFPVYGQANASQLPASATATAHLTTLSCENTPPVRRQNRSCDQCRKGKRRCDAVILRDWTTGESSEIGQTSNGE